MEGSGREWPSAERRGAGSIGRQKRLPHSDFCRRKRLPHSDFCRRKRLPHLVQHAVRGVLGKEFVPHLGFGADDGFDFGIR